MKLTGTIVIEKVAVGSKSQRDAYCLKTKDKTYICRRYTGPSFGTDEVLENLIGETIVAYGDKMGTNDFFFINKWKIL